MKIHLLTKTLALSALAAISLNARASSLTWDDGAGNMQWDITSANWGSGGLWNNAALDSATFETTGAGTILLGTPITAGNITFNTVGYEIGGTNLLTLSSSTITANADASITAALSGATPLNIAGFGTLYSSGQNTNFTGDVAVNGNLHADGSNSPCGTLGNSTHIQINSGGTILVGGDNSLIGAVSSGAKTITINNGGVLSTANNESVRLNALVLNGGTLASSGAGRNEGNWGLEQGVSTPGNGSFSLITGGNIAMPQTGGTLFDVGGGDTLTVASVLAHTAGVNDFGFRKGGKGTMVLQAYNTLMGAASVNNGTLIVDLNGVMPRDCHVSVSSSGVLAVYGEVDGPIAVSSGGALIGSGTIAVSPVTINAGGTLAPGDSSAMGTLFLQNALTFASGSTNIMRIAKTGGAPSSDVISGFVTLTCGGTLVVKNVTSDSTALANGDTFSLYSGQNGVGVAGNFDHLVLPILPAGLSWDVSQLAVNGSISIINAVSTPTFSLPGGAYLGALSVTITCVTPGAVIHYTTDGITPTMSSPVYSGPIAIPANSSMTISALGSVSGFAPSVVAIQTYTTGGGAGIWIDPAGGSWSTASEWANNIVPNFSGGTADFSTLTLGADTSVTLDAAWTIGNLVFGDVGATYNWTLNSGNGGNLTLAGGTPTITVQNGRATINANLNGSLVKNGPGTLQLTSGNNNFNGADVTVNGGTLAADGPNATEGALRSAGNITVNSGGTITVDGNNSFIGWGGSSGSKTMTIKAGGTITNAWSTSHLNALVMDGGTLGAGQPSPWANWNLDWTISTPGDGSSSAFVGNGNLALNHPGGTEFNIGAGDTLAVSTSITHQDPNNAGDFGLIKTGSGTLLLQGGNTYTSATTVNGGMLGGTGTIVSPVTVNAGGTLAPGTPSAIGKLTLNNTLTLTAGGTLQMRISKTGGVMTSDALASLTGLTLGGTLLVNNATTDATPLAFGDSFALFPQRSGSYSGSFAAINLPALPGLLVWDTNNLWVDGTLRVSQSGTTAALIFSLPAGGYFGAQSVAITCATPSATIYYTTDGTSPTTGSSVYSGPITVPAPGVTTLKAFATASGFTASPVASATYNLLNRATWINPAGGSWPTATNWSLNLIGSGHDVLVDFSTLTLTGDASVTLDGGSKTIGNLLFGDVGASHNWRLDWGSGGPLYMNATNAPTITVLNQTANIALDVITTNGLTKNGPGTLALISWGNNFSGGPITVNAGTLQAYGGNTGIGTLGNCNVNINSGATIFVGGANSYMGWGNHSGTTTTINSGGTLDAGNTTCHMNAVMLNGGTMQAENASQWGNFNLDWGVSTPGNGSSSAITGGNISVSQGGGTVFNIGSGDTLTISAVIDHNPGNMDDTGVIKTGSGKLVLQASNNYITPSTVNGGVLQVDGSLDAGSTVYVASSGTLAGSGTIGGPVTVDGTLAPGTSLGALTIANALTLNAGCTTVMELNRALNTYNQVSGVSDADLWRHAYRDQPGRRVRGRRLVPTLQRVHL